MSDFRSDGGRFYWEQFWGFSVRIKSLESRSAQALWDCSGTAQCFVLTGITHSVSHTSGHFYLVICFYVFLLYACILMCFVQLYNVFWSNSRLICNMHWLSLQACSWVSGHALRRDLCCLRFPPENRRSMSLCKYTTVVHTSSLTLRYIMVMGRCVFVYATKKPPNP